MQKSLYIINKNLQNRSQGKNIINRSSNFELLRIIAMFFIVLHHFALNNFTNINSDVNIVILQILSSFGKVGVNLFVLITGFYVIKYNGSLKKILKLYIKAVIYSVGIYLIVLSSGVIQYDNFIFKKSTMILTMDTYWFLTTYILLTLFIPFIKKFVLAIDKTTHGKLLIILFTIWVIIPFVTTNDCCYNNLAWFIFLCLLGAYISLYEHKIYSQKRLFFILLIFIIFEEFLMILGFNYLKDSINFFNKPFSFYISQNNLLIFSISVIIFILFKNLKIKSNTINIISSTTFGIYLIHEQPLLRVFLWQILFVCNLQNPFELVIYGIFSTLTVFMICFIIDLFFQKVLFKCINRFIDRCFDKLGGNSENNICNKCDSNINNIYANKKI